MDGHSPSFSSLEAFERSMITQKRTRLVLNRLGLNYGWRYVLLKTLGLSKLSSNFTSLLQLRSVFVFHKAVSQYRFVFLYKKGRLNVLESELLKFAIKTLTSQLKTSKCLRLAKGNTSLAFSGRLTSVFIAWH